MSKPELDDEIEIERANARLIAAHKEAAFVRGDMPPEAVEARMKGMSRRSFLWGALAVGATVGGVKWIGAQRTEDGAVWPLRRALQTNEEIWRDLSNQLKLAPTFPARRAQQIRANGNYGLSDDFDAATWKMNVEGLDGAPAQVTLDHIKKLPKITMTTELKCIEGWSIIVSWAGVRFSDFMAKFHPQTQSGNAPDIAGKPQDLVPYVSMITPNQEYYVGLDMPSMMHPQTLLAYEMNGAPLTVEHGAPLRLVTPTKYGIKQIKRIGRIEFTTARPADFWGEQGYDWYSGH